MLKKGIIIFILLAIGLRMYSLFFEHNAKRSTNILGDSSKPQDFGRVGRISGLIVPHHNVVADTRRALFKEIATHSHPRTIVLISPNHFEQGAANIQTTSQTWEVTPENVDADTMLIRKLDTVVVENDRSFISEHGIYNIIPDIATFFPDARVVPLIIKRHTSLDQLTKLHDILNTECPSCLMISSVDFSHYQPALVGDLHDLLSLRALRQLDVNTLMKKAEVDSPESLALLALWATSQGTKNFHEFDHTNTGYLHPSDEREATTHIFGWYEDVKPESVQSSLTFMISGDTMLGRDVGVRYYDNLKALFSGISDRFFWGTDLAIVNHEGAVGLSYERMPHDPESLRFTFDAQAPSVLAQNGITAVSLANNHSLNGDATVTKKMLQDANIAWFGSQANIDDTSVLSTTVGDITLDVVGVNTFSSPFDIDAVIHSRALQGHRIIVFPHWGVEYQKRHSSEQERLAHRWIDAGADLVIGSHPHVVQDLEVYKGRPVIYSLGNFIFDQSFSRETQQGITAAGVFDAEGLSLFLIPTESVNYIPQIMQGAEKKALLTDLYEPWKEYMITTKAGTKFYFKK